MKSANPRSLAQAGHAGFTLIELLVVMTIISLLAVALLPNIIGPMDEVRKISDEANLRWHYQQIVLYKKRYGRYPEGGGPKFILGPWIKGVVEHTENNRDRYFSAAVVEDEHVFQLKEQSVDEIWKDLDSISSLDTHYAGRGRKYKRTMESGREIWMATDNEDGRTHRDGTIVVLMGDGSTRRLLYDRDLVPKGAPAEPEEGYVFPVGPDSPHAGLAKLEH